MGESLGVALATLINTFNFPLYLLSGGMLPAWDLFAPPMLAEVQRALLHLPRAIRNHADEGHAGQ